MSTMFVLCSKQPKLTSLSLGWSECLELSVQHRNKLLSMLDEVRSKEIQAYRRR